MSTEATETYPAIRRAIIEVYGERCEQYSDACPTCAAWAEFDSIDRAEAVVDVSLAGAEPCPWHGTNTHLDFEGDEGGPWWVVCEHNCGGEGPYGKTKAEALALWNIRSDTYDPSPVKNVDSLITEPCPWHGTREGLELQTNGSRVYFVVCGKSDCGCEGPYRHSEEEALAAWNSRNKPSTSGLVRRMCSIHGDSRGPARGAGHKDGGRSRDPFHLAEAGATKALCGRDVTEYLEIDRMAPDAAAALEECCLQCARTQKEA